MTIENGTVLKHQVDAGQIILPDEEQIPSQYRYLTQWAKTNGYDHYELSNFSKEDYRSIHNQHYWFTVPIWALVQVRIPLTEKEGFGTSVTTTCILKVWLYRGEIEYQRTHK